MGFTNLFAYGLELQQNFSSQLLQGLKSVIVFNLLSSMKSYKINMYLLSPHHNFVLHISDFAVKLLLFV